MITNTILGGVLIIIIVEWAPKPYSNHSGPYVKVLNPSVPQPAARSLRRLGARARSRSAKASRTRQLLATHRGSFWSLDENGASGQKHLIKQGLEGDTTTSYPEHFCVRAQGSVYSEGCADPQAPLVTDCAAAFPTV